MLDAVSSSLKLKYVKSGYQYLVNHLLTLMLTLLIVTLYFELLRLGPYKIMNLLNTLHPILNLLNSLDPIHVLLTSFFVTLSTIYVMSKPHSVYLVDFACYKPPAEFRTSFATYMEHSKIIWHSQPRCVDFQQRILERSGLGDETCLPPVLHLIPPQSSMKDSREEAEMVIFSAMDSLFHKTGLHPTDVDILIINCSILSPTPSLSAMVINKYKMKEKIRSFNLSGMGCSASLISIRLVYDLLQAHPSYNAVVLSTEIVTPICYQGKERSMLIPNCLFRMGGAAILLSSKKTFRNIRAKYSLLHLVRTHNCGDDKSYHCVQGKEDSEGIVGIWLSKELLTIAGESLRLNMTALGPLVLPASEKLRFLINFIARKMFSRGWRPYIPDFKHAFEHFCIHAGGRAVIDGVQNSMHLSTEQVEASRATLHRFGNTSSSTLWYELSYIEAKGRMKKGDKVWQLAFGSGYKCNSAVWKCTETVKAPTDGPWFHCIHNYPARLP